MLISVATCAFWCLRQAIKLAKRGHRIRVSVIDAAVAAGEGGRKAFHVPSYHRKLYSRKVFDNGTHIYGGKREFLIWGTIPAEAVLCDFNIADFMEFCSSQSSLQNLFRLRTMSGTGDTDRALRLLKLDQHVLNHESVEAMAKFMGWFPNFALHENPTITTKTITKFVWDICMSWYVRPAQPLTYTAWATLAETFVSSLSPAPPTLLHDEYKESFLYGVLFSYGKEKWERDLATGMEQVRRNARKDGLGLPDEVLATEKHSLTTTIRRFYYSETPVIAPSTPRARPRPQQLTPAQTPTKAIITPFTTPLTPVTPITPSSEPAPTEHPSISRPRRSAARVDYQIRALSPEPISIDSDSDDNNELLDADSDSDSSMGDLSELLPPTPSPSARRFVSVRIRDSDGLWAAAPIV